MVKRRKDFVPQSVDPEFYQAFELQATLPGPSTLTVEVWDHACTC